MSETIEDYVKNQKFEELDANYLVAKEFFVDGDKIYKIGDDNLIDITMHHSLNQGATIVVEEGGVKSLVSYTAQETTTLLMQMCVYINLINASLFNKGVALEALTEYQEIVAFDVSIP